MERKANLRRNGIFHLEDSMIRYGVYNAESNEKIVKTTNNKIKLHEMKYYFHLNLKIGMVGTTQKKALHIMLLTQYYI